MADPVVPLLAELRALREGRDRWHSRAPEILRVLRAQGISLPEIREATGVALATAHRLSRTSDRSTCCGAPR